MADKQPPIRTLEVQTKEVFVDVNDLIIKLMMMKEKESAESDRRLLQKVIKLLEDMRAEGHKKP